MTLCLMSALQDARHLCWKLRVEAFAVYLMGLWRHLDRKNKIWRIMNRNRKNQSFFRIFGWILSFLNTRLHKMRFSGRNKADIKKLSEDLKCLVESYKAVGVLIWHLEPCWNEIWSVAILKHSANINVFLRNFQLWDVPDVRISTFWSKFLKNWIFHEILKKLLL